jgi:hypothetical protein
LVETLDQLLIDKIISRDRNLQPQKTNEQAVVLTFDRETSQPRFTRCFPIASERLNFIGGRCQVLAVSASRQDLRLKHPPFDTPVELGLPVVVRIIQQVQRPDMLMGSQSRAIHQIADGIWSVNDDNVAIKFLHSDGG